MIKLLVLNYEFPPIGGGGSPVSFDLSEELSRGHDSAIDIDVVTMKYGDLPEYEEINEHFRIYRVKCWRSKKAICHPWEQLTYLFSAYFKCKKLFTKHKYNLCHVHFIIPTGILALWLKRKFNLDYIVTSQGSDVINYNPRFKYLYPLVVGIWKRVLDSAKKIITPSKFLKGCILKVYPRIDISKFEIIPNGIERDRYRPLPKERYILLVSRLFINKGFQDFLLAIKNFDLKGWVVKIVGDGPYRGQLEKLVEKYNLENKVNFLGWIDNKSSRLKELYGKASIFILPSWFENINISLLEAMQAGCAVIASDAGANPEVVGEKELFRVRDSENLQEKILNLISDEDKIKEMGLTAQLRAENFTWEAIARRYKKLFEQYAK